MPYKGHLYLVLLFQQINPITIGISNRREFILLSFLVMALVKTIRETPLAYQ